MRTFYVRRGWDSRRGPLVLGSTNRVVWELPWNVTDRTHSFTSSFMACANLRQTLGILWLEHQLGSYRGNFPPCPAVPAFKFKVKRAQQPPPYANCTSWKMRGISLRRDLNTQLCRKRMEFSWNFKVISAQPSQCFVPDSHFLQASALSVLGSSSRRMI